MSTTRLPLDVRERAARSALQAALVQLCVAVNLMDETEYSPGNVVWPLRDARDSVADIVNIVEGKA